MPSAEECLEAAASVLSRKYDVKFLTPRKRERSSWAYKKPYTYITPIEFTVNGVHFHLYGNILMTNEQYPVGKDSLNIWDVNSICRYIIGKLNETKKQQKSERKTEARKEKPSAMARFFQSCVL